MAGDPDYVSWLQINHPDSLFLQHHTGPQDTTSSGESLLSHFSDVIPLEEIAVNSSPPDRTGTNETPTLNFSKFLISPQVSTPTGQKGQPPPQARLLTSSAVLEILQKKRRSKRKQR